MIEVLRSCRPLMAAALLLTVSACTAATPTSPTRPRDRYQAARLTMVRFLAFGDSLTAGTTSPAVATRLSAGLPQSYPAQLLSLLTAHFINQSVFVENAGEPGERAETGALRLPRTLEATTPDVMILLHGANNLGGGQTVVGATVDAVRTMVRDAKRAGAHVILCTLPPQRPTGFRSVDPGALALFNQQIRGLAISEDVVLADLSRWVDISLIGADGLHPTEAGYAQLARVLFDLVRDEFVRPPSWHVGADTLTRAPGVRDTLQSATLP